MSESATTPPTRGHPSGEMSLVGYGVAAGTLLLLLPVLPFLAVYWLVDRLVGVVASGSDQERSARRTGAA